MTFQYFGYSSIGVKKPGRVFELHEIKGDVEFFSSMKVGQTRHTKFKNVYVERIR